MSFDVVMASFRWDVVDWKMEWAESVADVTAERVALSMVDRALERVWLKVLGDVAEAGSSFGAEESRDLCSACSAWVTSFNRSSGPSSASRPNSSSSSSSFRSSSSSGRSSCVGGLFWREDCRRVDLLRDRCRDRLRDRLTVSLTSFNSSRNDSNSLRASGGSPWRAMSCEVCWRCWSVW